MKKIILILSLAVVLFSCEERGPDIRLKEKEISADNFFKDTTFIATVVEQPQTKNILVEDMTGVKCSNCPTAHDIVKDFKTQLPGRIVSVSIHDFKAFSPPYGDDVNMNTDAGRIIAENIVDNFSKPVGAFDRVRVNNDLFVTLNFWQAYLDDRKDVLTTPVNLSVDSIALNENSDTMNVQIGVHFTAPVSNNLKITVLVTENGIIADQQAPTELVKDYVHDDVLRLALSNALGDMIPMQNGSEYELGRTYKLNYTASTAAVFDLSKAHIVAFVTSADDNESVLQAIEVHL